MTVFEKHKTELEIFQKLYPGKTGQLAFAICILSDVSETLTVLSLKETDFNVLNIIAELNEVKELLSSYIKEESKKERINRKNKRRRENAKLV